MDAGVAIEDAQTDAHFVLFQRFSAEEARAALRAKDLGPRPLAGNERPQEGLAGQKLEILLRDSSLCGSWTAGSLLTPPAVTVAGAEERTSHTDADSPAEA